VQEEEGVIDTTVPHPSHIASSAIEAKKTVNGRPGGEHDRTKEPMEEAMWKQLRPILHIIWNIADGWERFEKYFP